MTGGIALLCSVLLTSRWTSFWYPQSTCRINKCIGHRRTLSRSYLDIRPRCSAASTMRVVVEGLATTSSPAGMLPRSGHCASTLPEWHEHDIIVFGGYTEDAQKKRQATNEAWTFSRSEKQWHAVQYARGPVPQPRLTSQALVVGDFMWVIAGWDGGPGFFSDVWKLNLRTYAWQEVEPVGEELPQISRFQAAAVGPRIYIHHHKSLEDILVLDTSTKVPVLSKMPVSGVFPDDMSPASRGLHTVTPLGHRLYLFGGAPKSGPMMDDLWQLDIPTKIWHKLHPQGGHPLPRCSQAAAAVGSHHLVMFGGAYYKEEGQLEVLDSLVCFDTKANEWVPVEVVEGKLPAARNASMLVPLKYKPPAMNKEHEYEFILYSGWKPFKETYNDTYSFKFYTH